eukprot:Skav223675  [mRNA]  locus=scaffold2691:105498:106691:+ [translate_table: standard]
MDGFLAAEKLPTDSVQVQFGGSLIAPPVAANPTSAPSSGAAPAAGAAPPAPSTAVLELDEDMELAEAAEAEMLGLAVEQTKKRKSLSNMAPATKRRSKEEMYEDEIDKIELEVSLCVANLADWPKKPTGYEIGQVDRKTQSKLKQVQGAALFDLSTRVERFQVEIKHVRDCCKAAGQYLPAKGVPKRAHKETFFNAFSAAFAEVPKVVNSFPPTVQQHFIEMGHEKEMKSQQWDKVSANLCKDRLANIYGDDAEKQAVTMFERVLAYILEDCADDNMGNLLLEACTKVLEGPPHDEVISAIKMLIQLVTLDPQGASSLDSLVTALREQSNNPIMRILFKTDSGKDLMTAAETKNTEMVQTASKVSDLLEVKDSVRSDNTNPPPTHTLSHSPLNSENQ